MSLKIFLSPSLIRFMLVVFCLSTISPLTSGQQKRPAQKQRMNVAVLDFESRGGVTKDDAASLSDAFQGQIIETNEFIVVDRNRIKAILTEQGFQQSEACSQVECIAEVGKILKVEKMFAGTIGMVGRIYTVNIQVVDVTTAQITSNKSRRHDGDIEELLTDIIPEIAAEMASELTGKEVEVASGSSGGGSSWLWYVGGAVLIGGGAAAYLMMQKKDESATTTSATPLPDSPNFP